MKNTEAFVKEFEERERKILKLMEEQKALTLKAFDFIRRTEEILKGAEEDGE